MAYQEPYDKFATDVIHAGQEPEQWTSRMVVPAITMSTTFKQEKPGELACGRYEYSRGGNPTRDCLEKCVAKIEAGFGALAFASGLAATTAVCQTFLSKGDHIVTSDDVYGGTNRLFSRILSKMGVTASFVDLEDLDKVRAAFKPETKLVWIETPTNPTMKIIDIQEVTAIAREKGVLSCVDNTFMSAYFQRPIALGADMTFHSATKYMNGHSDVVMGLVICKTEDLYKQLHFTQFAAGAIPSPFDSYLCNRGLKTLHVRMERHHRNAIACAKMLVDHPKIEKINYPGHESHPRHHIMLKQATGCSGMMGLWLKDANLDMAGKFLSSLKVFTLAESLGGFESLAEHPMVMTHASVPADQRVILGITENFIRLSVGLEDEADLVADLKQAIEKAYE